MAKKILVCLDKFKGTLTQSQAAEIIHSTLANASIEHILISDGGEGFLDTI